MKLLGIVFCMTLTLALVAFSAIAMMDVPVNQTQISKTVPNERFYSNGGTQ